jgi:hypothetical protein
MTGIDGVGGSGPASPLGGARSVRRAGVFSLPETAAAEEAAPAVETLNAAPAAALGGMLALQEAGAETVRDRAARRHGLALLAALNALQRALLGGADGADSLARLAELAEAVPAATDPRLAGVLQAIALRARVELARRG